MKKEEEVFITVVLVRKNIPKYIEFKFNDQ